jgi:hypothetical protein
MIPVCAATVETQINLVLNVISLGVVLIAVVMISRMRSITEGNAEFLSWWRRYYAIPARDSAPASTRLQEDAK